jgi:hypothetical protein
MDKPHTLSVLLIFARTFGLMLLFTICNWAVSTLLSGSGTPKRIWIVCSYAILPFSLTMFIKAVLSNFVLYDEIAFFNMLVAAGIAWSVFMLVIGLKEVHQYTVKQTIANIVLTLFSIAFVMFLFVLFGSLLQELFAFFISIFNEGTIRS